MAELLTSDGNFGAQSNGVKIGAPWGGGDNTYYPTGSTAGQSPFTNLFAENSMGANWTEQLNTTQSYIYTPSFFTIPVGTSYLYMNFDFRNTSAGTTDGDYKVWAAPNANASLAGPMIHISASKLSAEGPSGSYQEIALVQDAWYNVVLTLDLTAKTYSGYLTKYGDTTRTEITSRSFRSTSGTINSIASDVDLGRVVGACPVHDIDNFAIGTDAIALPEIPEPGALALLAAGLIGLLAYAWRKRK